MRLLFLGTWEIILIVLVVLLLFGGKKIPELMKGLGKGVKSFKDGVSGIEDAAQIPTDSKPSAPKPNTAETQQESTPPEA